MLAQIRKQLLKLDSIRGVVEDYRQRQKEERYRKRWANLMSSSYAIRNIKPVKLEPFDTLGVVTLEEYHSGKVVDRDSMILNSTNWGTDMKKAPAPTEAEKKETQGHCTTEVWTAEQILRNEG